MKCLTCKKDFNNCCMTRRSPGLVHSNFLYHRATCEYRIRMEVDKGMDTNKPRKADTKCDNCKYLYLLNGKKLIPCEYPLNLVDGFIPNEELPKLPPI